MSSGMFRGKESSNRIELSQLVQELLNFGVLGSLQLWGVGGGWMGVGVVGGAPIHVHMHARTHTHIYMLNMIISIANGSPHWGNPWEFPMMSYAHVCACAFMCTCVGAPTHHPHSYPPTPQGGGPSESVKIQ